MKLSLELTIDQIIEALPPINAIGETNIDEKRYNNLREQEELIYTLISRLVEASETKGRPEYSMNLQGRLACSIIKEIKMMLEGF